ncbi:MAG: cell division protein ZapB [Deltaproteobacteria bacterium]|nr:cell division protein ZapB [Deltaproteobacteria bacterium]
MALDSFERLEEKITGLLDGCDGLKAENSDLKESLKARTLEVDELKGRLKRLNREKTTVREKVEALLSRIDGLIEGV